MARRRDLCGPGLVAAMGPAAVASTGFAFVRSRSSRPSPARVGHDRRCGADLEAFADLLDELNVKDVYVTEEIGDLATFILRPDGGRWTAGKDVQAVFSAARSGDWTANDTAPSMSAATCSSPTVRTGARVARGCGRCCARSNDFVTLDTDVRPNSKPRSA